MSTQEERVILRHIGSVWIGRARFPQATLRLTIFRASVIRQGIFGQPGSDAFDVLCDGGSEFNSNALEFFALSTQ